MCTFFCLTGKPRFPYLKILAAIKDFRKQMPCGFPEIGIPPLAPLQIAKKSIQLNGDGFVIFKELSDIRIDGLNDFNIKHVTESGLPKQIELEFFWNKISLTANYVLHVLSVQTDEKVLIRSGQIKFSVGMLKALGEVRYNFESSSDKLSLKKLKVYVLLDEVKSEIDGLSKYPIINNKINNIIEKWVLLVVNDYWDKLAEFTDTVVLEKINEKISDKTVSELLNIIKGGGDNNVCV